MMCNFMRLSGYFLFIVLLCAPSYAQYYPDDYYPNSSYYSRQGDPSQYGAAYNQSQRASPNNLHYDNRDAEMILREQLERAADSAQQQYDGTYGSQHDMYDAYYGHRLHDESQVGGVMGEARFLASLIKNRNGKSFIVFDKRNFQFYLFDRNGKLLRIGPVAIGKGKTHVGAFETPVGVFPIKTKLAVDDWVRPDWYFIEENEPIPQRWEDRRVPGFFRYKLVFDGSRYIHYAEATGGRLTHGCLGLDWEDAEAVFHTLQVGSYCIVVDPGFINRLSKGEFPIQKPAEKPEDRPAVATAKNDSPKAEAKLAEQRPSVQDRVFSSLW
jgi:hypothetical protein